MSNLKPDQIGDWLKKLERESWQLELLVSAFTIFLLLQAIEGFDSYTLGLQFEYNPADPVIMYAFLFLSLISQSLFVLSICLIGHLMLRGFWIGAIGLRSVQSSIDFKELRYSSYFTERLSKKVTSLDQLVIRLDEICSVIFAFAFLLMSVLLSFGMYLLLIAGILIVLTALVNITPEWFHIVITISSVVIMLGLFLGGLMYLIDYFTLGFFKKFKWLSRVYYPVYRFFGIVSLAFLSRSIYYYLISKFSKKRIRCIFAVVSLIVLIAILIEFNQKPYFPVDQNPQTMMSNYYDDQRPPENHIERASVDSRQVSKGFVPLFIRYSPADNGLIGSLCEDFEPLREDGINWKLEAKVNNANLHISGRDYSGEDFEQLLSCLSSIYQVKVNDQEMNLSYHFYTHPSKSQNGLLSMISSDSLKPGQNVIEVLKWDGDGFEDYAYIPIWYDM